ncbi:SitI3 family protein [Kibdelosporangium persicum]|uniref:Uncharacterized protein n=1 Tax=Kibdelosporangium persicum TaxID=2698649 RepID=A0ABX2FAU7_9PSEU|nr:SitI3 family protein [Kibdelosporangium persicum]NRN68343.1 hypothetical protein [Kibdelosporangium persicum]
MSISYKLELGAPVAPRTVMAAALEAGGDAIERYEGNTGWLRSGAYFDVDAAEYDPPDPVEQSFGFPPTVEIYFGLKKVADFDAQETDVLRVSLGVLDRIPGDALVHYQHELVWLLRKNGQLTINDDPEMWPPGQRALITQPYEAAPLSW